MHVQQALAARSQSNEMSSNEQTSEFSDSQTVQW